MSWLRVFWDFEPGGNAEHAAEDTVYPVTAFPVED